MRKYYSIPRVIVKFLGGPCEAKVGWQLEYHWSPRLKCYEKVFIWLSLKIITFHWFTITDSIGFLFRLPFSETNAIVFFPWNIFLSPFSLIEAAISKGRWFICWTQVFTLMFLEHQPLPSSIILKIVEKSAKNPISKNDVHENGFQSKTTDFLIEPRAQHLISKKSADFRSFLFNVCVRNSYIKLYDCNNNVACIRCIDEVIHRTTHRATKFFLIVFFNVFPIATDVEIFSRLS